MSEREKVRQDSDNIKRPNTKWVFVGFASVDVKVVLARQLLLGRGPLPDWLRNLAHGRSMVALDTYQDNLCLWRCIAVHRGANPQRSTQAARELAKSFYKLSARPDDVGETSLDELDSVERHLNKNAPLKDWFGIHVYEPERRFDGEILWYLRRNPPAKLKNILTICIYKGHAFVITDITKLAKTYACVHCRDRFTRVGNLQRHSQICSQGKTIIVCTGERVEAPKSSFAKVFFPQHFASQESIRWLEQEAKQRKMYVHHAMCGHGGERWVERAPVDGYNHETKTVFQYHGCHWHGCIRCFPNDRHRIIAHDNTTREEWYRATLKRIRVLREVGYHVIEVWACEVGEIDVEVPRAETRENPHAILYDFESYGDKNQRKELTKMLTIENVHVPISVSVGDTLDREPTRIWEKDPAELVRTFMEELERRARGADQG